MNARELPIVFDCEGQELLGMVHVPEQLRTQRGLLLIVAGGPQYRGGVCRMQVQMARQLAAQGVPVMRFDYRGLGDSEGEFRGFEDVEADLRAALQAFRAQVPGMREVALWGGCDAASAALINGWKFPEVTGLVLGNPWVHNAETGDAVTMQHYGQRLRDKDFWLKVLRGQYNPLPAVGTVLRSVFTRLRRTLVGAGSQAEAVAADGPDKPFLPRMRNGMARFKGDVLMLMSGRSLLSKEFDELVARHADWQRAMTAPRHLVRHEIAEADQAFSSIDARLEVNQVTLAWMLDPRADLRRAGARG